MIKQKLSSTGQKSLQWIIFFFLGIHISFNKASIIISISAKAIRRIKLGERIKFQKGEIEIDEKYIKAGLKESLWETSKKKRIKREERKGEF